MNDEWMLWDGEDEDGQDQARWMKEVNQEEWEKEMQKIEAVLFIGGCRDE